MHSLKNILQNICTMLIMLGVCLIPVNTSADATTITQVSLSVDGDVIVPGLNASPSVINIAESTVISSGSLVLASGEVLEDMPCVLTLSSPAVELVVASTTDQNGECVLDTSTPAQSQGWTLVNGDQSLLSSQPGTINASIEFQTPLGNFTASTTVTVENNIFIVPPVISVDKDAIEIDETVVYVSEPIVFTDGSIYANQPVVLTLQAPNGIFEVSGNTDDEGVFTIDFGEDLEDQGIGIIQGSVDDLFSDAGTITATLRAQDTVSNDPETVIRSGNIIPILDDLPRTGGAQITVVVVIAVLIAMVIIYFRSRKKSTDEKDVEVS